MSTFQDCSWFATFESDAQSDHKQHEAGDQSEVLSQIQTHTYNLVLHSTNTPTRQGIPDQTLWLNLITDPINADTGVTFHHLPVFSNSLQHNKKLCQSLST